MLSAAFAVHPAAVASQRHSVRQRQQFCAPIGTATPRRRLPVAMLSVTNAVATQSRESAPASPRKLSFPILF
ncbi:unnamed protein product [Triticum turgidum subsp. durum]|uniref:Uncharacterized protein n=1 Tax=Triticum turgidum subsp. durum TaxID=4567 RepID=A0A9R0Q4K2_TRITD|nr:unnamed protein product [Triticum turgidum subsp. durum]